ncbi:MAG: sigma-70 family RNA polymerase sigma factor [Caldilineaceae bacterium]
MIDLPATVAAARSGNDDAFARIVAHFQDMAYACAYGWTSDFHLAQDVAQEAFLDAWLHLHQLREPTAFPGWLRRIVVKHADRETRRKHPAFLPVEAADELPSAQPEPEALVQAAEQQRRIQAAVDALPEHQRIATALFYLDGYSQQEIADFLELPVSTIKKRLYDARNGLKRRIDPMTRQEMQAQRPSQTDEFADRVAFFVALRTHNLRRVKELIEKNSALLEVRTEWTVASEGYFWPLGTTALHWAAATGDLALLTFLLDTGAERNAADQGGEMPLHLAVRMGETGAVRRLLDAGADVNASTKNGMTPLHHAALKAKPSMVELLVAHGAQVNSRDSAGHSPADWAARKGRGEIVDLLVGYGAEAPHDAPVVPYRAARVQPSTRTVPAGPQVLGRVLDAAGRPLDKAGSFDAAHSVAIHRATAHAPFLETGIKIIDLLCPLVRGGHNGLYTPLAGVGRMVVMSQLIDSIASLHNGRVVYAGLQHGPYTPDGLLLAWRGEFGVDAAALKQNVALVFGEVDDPAATKQQVVETALTISEEFRRAGHEVLLLVESRLALTDGTMAYLRANAVSTPDAAVTILVHGDESAGAEPPALADLDAVISFSRARAVAGLWPSIDPLESHSKLLAHPLLDASHRQVAAEVLRHFRRYEGLHPMVESKGLDGLFYLDERATDEKIAIRARRLHRYLTQPFPGLETFTGQLGAYVPAAETVATCRAILDGVYDGVEEKEFLFVTSFGDK